MRRGGAGRGGKFDMIEAALNGIEVKEAREDQRDAPAELGKVSPPSAREYISEEEVSLGAAFVTSSAFLMSRLKRQTDARRRRGKWQRRAYACLLLFKL
jgi:hypothetical protein